MRVFSIMGTAALLLFGGAVSADEPVSTPSASSAKEGEKSKDWYLAWFEKDLDAKAAANYKIEAIDVKWSTARVFTHQAGKAKANPKKIISLLPKKSKSYPKSFGKLLNYLGENFPGSSVTLLNYGGKDKDEEIKNGLAVLAYAKAQKADLIFTMGSEAAELAGTKYANCGIPVITCNNKDPVEMGLLKKGETCTGNNIAYTTVTMPMEAFVHWMEKFRPSLVNVAVIYDDSLDQVKKSEVAPLKELLENKVAIIDVTAKSKESASNDIAAQMPQVLAQMRQKDAKLENSVFIVTSSASIWETPAMGVVAKGAENCPVLTTITDAVTGKSDGALLGIGLDRGTSAHLASIYAGRILSGADPGKMPVGSVSPPDIAINFAKAREINITIPFEIFENATFIYNYKGELVVKDSVDGDSKGGEAEEPKDN